MHRGDRLGRYTLGRLIARGGMGEVWRARQDGLEREVAVKILRADVQTERARALFEREAENLARLKSPHTVRILDVGVGDDGAPYLVTELLEGEDLWTRILRAGPLDWRAAVDIVDQVLAALAEAHALNLVHRDIKPANVFLQAVPGAAQVVRVLDFGISKLIDPTVDADDTLLPGLKGSPRYMAPEQIDGRRASKAIDVYAVGALLYCMLLGEPPFKGELIVVLRSQLKKQPTPLTERGVTLPPALDALVMRCLSKDPAVRPASIETLRALLAKVRTRAEDPAPAPPEPVVAEADTWAPALTERAPSNPEVSHQDVVRKALIGLVLLLVGLLAWRTTKSLLAEPVTPDPPRATGRAAATDVARAPVTDEAVRQGMVRVVVDRPARFVDFDTGELLCDRAPACLVSIERPVRVEAEGGASTVLAPGRLAAHRGARLEVSVRR